MSMVQGTSNDWTGETWTENLEYHAFGQTTCSDSLDSRSSLGTVPLYMLSRTVYTLIPWLFLDGLTESHEN